MIALEKWRHWLEGAEHPFIIWTHHKNFRSQFGQETELSSGAMSAVLGRVQVYSDLPPGIRESDVFSRLEEVDEEVT